MHSRDEFLDEVLSEVKFKMDHKAIKRELNDHLDEKVEYLVSRGESLESAQESAIESMGDAYEIGSELNLVHKPFWGWALYLSRITLVVLVFLFCLNFVYPTIQDRIDEKDASKNFMINNNLEYNSQSVNLKFNFGTFSYRIDDIYYADDGNTYVYIYQKNKNPFHLFNGYRPFKEVKFYINNEKNEPHGFSSLNKAISFTLEIPEGSHEMRIEIENQVQTIQINKGSDL